MKQSEKENIIALFGATGNVGTELLKCLATKTDSSTTKILIFSRGDPAETQKKFNLDKDIFTCVQTPYEKDQVHVNVNALALILQSFQPKLRCCFINIPQFEVYRAKEWVEPYASACAQAKVERMVKVGTGVPELYVYGRHHLAAENLIKEKGLKLTVLQGGSYSTNPDWQGPSPPGAPLVLTDVFWALSRLSLFGLKSVRTLGHFPTFLGHAKASFVDLRDFAEALVAVLLASKPEEHDGKVYLIISDPNLGTDDVAAVYGRLLGRIFSEVHVDDPSEQRAMIALGGYQGEMADVVLDMFERFSTGIFEIDSSDFKTLTGKSPRTFQAFAEEKVKASGKPPPRWLLRGIVVGGLGVAGALLWKKKA